jgi:hypothetical protein
VADRPASLVGTDGHVILSPHGARLVHLALEAATRQATRRDGGKPASDVEYLRTVLRLAVDHADGSATGSPGTPWRLVLPSSAARITTAEAAAILGVTERAVRLAAAQGRYGAERHGRVWSLSEIEVRQAARNGASHGNGRPQPVADPGCREDGPTRRRERPQVGTAGRSR